MGNVKVQEQGVPSRATQYIAAFIVNLMAFACGFSMGWPSTAIPYLEGPDSPIPLTSEESSWVTSLQCLAAAFTTPFAGLLPDRIGRKKTGYLMAASLIICWILVIFAENITSLYVARIFSGISSVGVNVFAPIYVVEISVDQVRGALGTFISILWNSGIAVAYVLGSVLTYEEVCYVNVSLPAIFIALFFWLPETPKYLVYSGKLEEAKKSLQWFRGNSYDITAEFNEIKGGNSNDTKDSHTPTVTFKEMFRSKATMRGLFIVLVLGANQQLSGIYPVLSYTVTIFRESGSDISPNLSAIIVGFLLVFGNIIAIFLVERAGRRILLITSNSIMTMSLICIGAFFYLKHIEADVSSIGWLPVTSLSIYVIALAIGVGPLLYTVLTEIISPQMRYIANTMCISLVWLLSFFGAKFFNNIADLIGVYSTYWIFSVCCFIAMLIIIFQLPETKGKSLDEIARALEGRCKKQDNMYDLPNI